MHTPTSLEDNRTFSVEIVPKIEDLEVDINDVKTVPSLIEDIPPISPTRIEKKRPRGRPRKHPQVSPSATTRPPNSRCKTGCQTCRKRKKKCDERKPTCFQCQKNNVVCEGYAPKERWRSGREREAEARKIKFEIPVELPTLIDGVETDLDRRLLNHFIDNASRVLSLHGEKCNPFTTVILPLAYIHRGVMHSILSLSSSHLYSLEPNVEFKERQYYHCDCAIQILKEEQKVDEGGRQYKDSTAVQAQTLMLFLRTIVDGDTDGEYRYYMDQLERLMKEQPPSNPEFNSLIKEFWYYHSVLNSVTSIDRRSMMEDFKLPSMLQPEAGALIGVMDGIFGFMSKVTNLRDKVRYRIENNEHPAVNLDCMSDATAIDTALRQWVCPHPEGTPRWIASLFYKHCTWVYLYRTTKPSRPHPTIKKAVDDGLWYLHGLPEETLSVLLMPLFLLGCAAFEEYQRQEISKAFDKLIGYSRLKNIERARVIVEKVWEMMDAGNRDSWDWEKIMKDKGWDFLIT
ncbi:hypothetical protein GQ43DRAFT_431835 [Delitschia confertaspora ATCC 74209]|uniref:Zn(2)-C6 fungal-type domain-containing protein n=1 Tax=Delitschia confertaspora ATCC 74209 TaxID=1513339 RepID=A0A9P4JKV4_9PLEO|nr:hypothetical protein GQ43DRAFT_431835 [Delitschia confertaspora ATCC 74209]